jgi:signal transduction histidine kinase
MRNVFVSMVSHELRQPLGAFAAAIQLLRLHLPQPSDKVSRALLVLERQTGHLTTLVNDLLDMARITQGKFTVATLEIDLVNVVRGVCEDFVQQAAERGVTFAADLPDGRVPIYGDAVRLRQVVSNLLINAVRHAGPNGVVTCALEIGKDEARLSVQDSGRGIDPAVLPHLFDMFVQGADAAVGGLGLGLTIAKGIIDLHHGAIQADNVSPLGGARFVVKLPLAARPPARSGSFLA